MNMKEYLQLLLQTFSFLAVISFVIASIMAMRNYDLIGAVIPCLIAATAAYIFYNRNY